MATPEPAVSGSADAVWISDESKSGGSSVVRTALGSESTPIAVNQAKNPDSEALIPGKAAIPTTLNGRYVLELRAQISDRLPSLVTKCAGNGSLASFLTAEDQRRFCSPNLRVNNIAGIAVAMRSVH